MIQRITVFLFCISVGISQSRVHVNSLVYSSGKWLDGKDNKPFTGIAYNVSNNTGEKIQESKYLKGLLHGTHIEWWEAGNKKVHGRYKLGKMNGRWVHYFENGQSNLKDTTKTEIRTDWRSDGMKMVLNDQGACITMARKRGNGYTGMNRGHQSIMYVFKQNSVQLL